MAVVAGFSILVSSPVRADHAPNRRCTDSGNICLSTQKVDGVRRLRLWMEDKKFDRFAIRLRGPNGAIMNRAFDVNRKNGRWVRSVRWRSYWPWWGEGAYWVRWHRINHGEMGRQILPYLGFHEHR